MSNATLYTDVLVVGGGPVGLQFAYDMARCGHKVIVVDKKSGPNTESRALFVSARTLDMLEHKGLAHHFLNQGIVMRGVNVFSQGSRLVSLEVPDSICETNFPQVTVVPQGKTEKIFVDALSEYEKEKGTLLQWNTELLSWSQDEEGVTANVTQHHEGSTTQAVIRAQYIIGADGCHSKVRKGDPSWSYDGHSVSTPFALADVVLEGEDVDKLKLRFNGFLHPEGACGILALPGDPHHTKFRVMANIGPFKRASSAERRVTHGIAEGNELDLKDLQAYIDERTKLKLVATQPTWLTYFHINERKANGFRRRRAFLIGDAAHCHSPAGGQGMNTGLQDASNLAWKLSLVLQGLAKDPDRLLDSFSTEREPIVESTMRNTGKTTEVVVSGIDWMPLFFSRWLLTSALSVQQVKDYLLGGMLQLHLAMAPDSPLLCKSSPGLLPAGQFVPDTHLLRCVSLGNAKIGPVYQKSLRQILHQSTRHVLLWVATRHAHQEPCTLTSTFLASAKDKFNPGSIRAVVVDWVSHVEQYADPSRAVDGEEDHWVEYNLTASDSITNRVGLTPFLKDQQDIPAALIIIRPDLYVAHSALISNVRQLNTVFAYLRTIIV